MNVNHLEHDYFPIIEHHEKFYAFYTINIYQPLQLVIYSFLPDCWLKSRLGLKFADFRLDFDISDFS